MKKEIAIIGYGRFGQCASHHLKKLFRVSVADSRKIRNVVKGVSEISITAAASKPIIILAVPINQTEALLKHIAPLLKPHTLVCDVCSVKEQPILWMKHQLPKHVSILGTHPLFGPDSASTNLRDRTIVLCPVRISKAQLRHIRTSLSSLGLKVILMTAQKHDRLMATTLFLTQCVGRGLLKMKLSPSTAITQNTQFLHHLVETTKNDTEELFRDMFQYNHFTSSIPNKLISAFQQTRRSLMHKP